MNYYKKLRNDDYNFFVGVPSSNLAEFIKELQVDNPHQYIPATREDSALTIALGAQLMGKKTVVFMQNSGLGHCVDVITSLIKPYGLPEPFLLIDNRNSPEQHEFMGKKTEQLLQLLEYKNYEMINQ